jgi:hypothetical protein
VVKITDFKNPEIFIENLTETQKYMLLSVIESLNAGEDVDDGLVMSTLGKPLFDFLRELFKSD